MQQLKNTIQLMVQVVVYRSLSQAVDGTVMAVSMQRHKHLTMELNILQRRVELLEMLSDEYIAGLSILGGDPFEPENQQTVYELCKIAKACYRQKDIWVWTGFMLEDVQNSHILDYVDVLVDGPFILEQKDLGLAYRGSRNQRVIDVKKSRAANGVVQLEGDWR